MVPSLKGLVSAPGVDSVPEEECLVALKEDVGYILHTIIAKVELRGDVDTYKAEIAIGRESSVTEEPKEDFDFIGGIFFPNS